MHSKSRQRQTRNGNVDQRNRRDCPPLTPLGGISKARTRGKERNKEGNPPRHLLVLSGASLADSHSHPNDRTCLILAVVNCQARTE